MDSLSVLLSCAPFCGSICVTGLDALWRFSAARVLPDRHILQQQLGLLHVTGLQPARQHGHPQPSAGGEHAGLQEEGGCLHPCHQTGWETLCDFAFLQIGRRPFFPAAQLIGHDCFNGCFFDFGGRIMQLTFIIVEETLNFWIIKPSFNCTYILCS